MPAHDTFAGVMSGRSIAALIGLSLLVLAPRASAQVAIRVVALENARVDGAIRDWRSASFTSVGEGPDASMRFAIGSDARGLYVAAEVWDDRLVRTASPGVREDAVILTLAASGRGARALDFYLFAGVTGVSAARVSVAPVGSDRLRPVPGASAVEGPIARGQGYTLEAFIPFGALPGGARGWQALRGSIRLRDVDREARPEVESEPALVAVDPRALERLVPLAPEAGAAGVVEEFLASRGLQASRPTHELEGDVAGDARPESVILVAGFLLVTGPGYRDGRGYAYHQLPVDRASDVRSAELLDLTADGKAELVVVIRQRNAQGERDLWQVVDLTADPPREVFAIEVRKAVGSAFVDAQVRVRRTRTGAPTIELRAGRAQGLDEQSYRESEAADVEPILLPWGSVLERTYRWSGRAFERVGERPNPRYRPPEEPVAVAAPPPPPVLPQAPSEDALLAAFRREHGIADGARARFRLSADLAGRAEPETVLVYGRRLVVVGPGVRQGTSFVYYEVPAASDADLLAVEVADVTGDRRAEVLMRVRQTFGDVQREVLLVHQLTNAGFPRLLSVEVARSQAANSIRNEVQTRGGQLTIEPGRASGWSAETWRFAPDPADDVAPLLLPWRDARVRYVLRGRQLVRS